MKAKGYRRAVGITCPECGSKHVGIVCHVKGSLKCMVCENTWKNN